MHLLPQLSASIKSLWTPVAGAWQCPSAFVTTCGRIYMQGSLSFVFDNCIPTSVCHIKGDVKGVCCNLHYGSPILCPGSSLVWPACPSGYCRQQADLCSSWAHMLTSGALPCSRTSTPWFCDSCSCWCCVFNSWSAGSIAFCVPSFFWDLFCFIFLQHLGKSRWLRLERLWCCLSLGAQGECCACVRMLIHDEVLLNTLLM